MLTVFLWAALVTLSLFLIIAASPIRAAVDIQYHQPEKMAFIFTGFYAHPLIFKYEYSSAAKKGTVKILGIEWKPRREKKNITPQDNANREHIDDTDSIKSDAKSGADNGVKAAHTIKTDAGAKTDNDTNINTNTQTDANTNSANIDASKKTNAKKQTPKKQPVITRIKSRIRNIKEHKIYKIISDKPLRDKLLKWFRRLFTDLFRLVSLEKLTLRAVVGYPDPAALGKFYGYFTAARSALELQNRSINISIEPIFTERLLKIDSKLSVKTSLSALLSYLLVLGVTFPYWRVYKIISKK